MPRHKDYLCYEPTVNGKQGRKVLLYQRWCDMVGRTRGYGTKAPEIYKGLEVGWANFDEFRTWALANGFSKEHSSPNRRDPSKGYTPDNVVFTSVYENSSATFFKALIIIPENKCEPLHEDFDLGELVESPDGEPPF